MFSMNAGCSTTGPLMSFLKLKDPWAWRSSQSNTPSEDHYGQSSCLLHLAALCFAMKPWLICCRFLWLDKLNPNARQTHRLRVAVWGFCWKCIATYALCNRTSVWLKYIFTCTMCIFTCHGFFVYIFMLRSMLLKSLLSNRVVWVFFLVFF